MLLERVFLRVGTAETDEQLQKVVSKFLPPVLLKLSSQQDGVRKKASDYLLRGNGNKCKCVTFYTRLFCTKLCNKTKFL